MTIALLAMWATPTQAGGAVHVKAIHVLALYGNNESESPSTEPAEKDAPRKKQDKQVAKAGKPKSAGDGGRAAKPQETREPMRPQATAVLGVMIGKPLDVQAAEIVRVWDGSSAEKAGLRVGDRIVKLDGEKIGSPEDLRASITHYRPGDKVTIVVERNDEEKQIEATLGGGDDFEGWSPRDRMQRMLSPRPWLGVEIGTGDGRGVAVAGVLPGSPAERAELQAGDAILRVEKTRVEAPADLQMAIAKYRPGESVQLVILRDDARQKVDVELGLFGVLQGRGEEARELLQWFLDGRFPF
jgi:S1-C subfamily serine protease